MSVAAATRMDVASIPWMLWMQVKALFLNYVRIPAFSLTSVILPVMFFAFFGLPNVHHNINGVNVGQYLLCSFGAYAVSSMMMFNFGIGVATSRGQKTDLLQRATPLPAAVSIVASIIGALIFALISLVALILFAGLAGGVWMSPATYGSLVLRLILGALPILALGMAIGYSSGPNAAPAVVNLIYLPMAFASGLFIPANELPDFIQKITQYLPLYPYGQLAWGTIGAADWSTARSVLALTVWGVILFALAVRAYRLDQTRKFA